MKSINQLAAVIRKINTDMTANMEFTEKMKSSLFDAKVQVAKPFEKERLIKAELNKEQTVFNNLIKSY